MSRVTRHRNVASIEKTASSAVETYVYRSYHHLRFMGGVSGILLLLGLFYVITSPPGTREAYQGWGFLGFLGLLILLWGWQLDWQWRQPRQRITIDREQRRLIFEWFRVSRPAGSFWYLGGRYRVPELVVAFDEVRDVYLFTKREVFRLDDKILARYFGVESLPFHRALQVVTEQGTVTIALYGLTNAPRLAKWLHRLSKATPAPDLKNNAEFKYELTLGIGLTVCVLILAAVSWDIESIRWIWGLFLAGGLFRLAMAGKAARHRGNSK